MLFRSSSAQNQFVAGVNYTDSITVTTADGTAQVLTVTITGSNDGPIAIGTNNAASEDVAFVAVVLEGTDVDGTITSFNLSSLPANGTLYTNAALTTVAVIGTNYTATANALTLYFVPATNWNGTTSLNFTATDNQGLVSASATETITVTAVNDAPVVGTATAIVSEEGLSRANADATGTSDTTNSLVASGTIAITDVDSSTFTVTFSAPVASLTSNGQAIVWTGNGTGTLVGKVGTQTIIAATISNTGAYTVTLSGPIDHAAAGVEDVKSFGIGVNVSDGLATTTSTLTVNIEDDSPVVISAPNNAVIESVANATLTGDLHMSVGADSGSLAKVVVTGTVDSGGFATGTVTNGNGTVVTQNLLYNGMKIQYLAGTTAGSIVATATDGTQVFKVTGDMSTSAYTVTMLKALDSPTYTSAVVGGITAGNTAGTYTLSDGNNVFTVLAKGTVGGIASTVNTSNGYFGVANNFIDVLEKLRFDFDGKMSGITLNVDQLKAGETLFYTAYDAFGAVVGSGSLAGQNINADIYLNLVAGNFTGGGFNAIEFTADAPSSYRFGISSLTGQSTKVDINSTFNLAGVDSDGDSTAAQAINLTFDANQSLTAGAGTSGYAMGGGGGDDTITGSAGDDNISGGAGADQLTGGAGADLLYGGTGNDSLVGGTGADTITGGAGNDTMTGGDVGVNDLTADTFVWNLVDAGTAGTPAVDRINNFATATASSGGDVLNLRDILTGETATASSLDNYLHFEITGGNTILHISSTGGFADNNVKGSGSSGISSATETQQIVFTGVDLTSGFTTDQQIIADLITKQKLITD